MKLVQLSALPLLSVIVKSQTRDAIRCHVDDPCHITVDEDYQTAKEHLTTTTPPNMRGRSNRLTPVTFTDIKTKDFFKLDAVGDGIVEHHDAETSTDTTTPNPLGQGGRFGLFQFRIPVINNYGCWCYGGESWPGARDQLGFGPVMDVYDDACKAHHMGFDCILKDAELENKVCHPTETSYDLTVTPDANGDYLIECSDSIEDDWCRKKTCLVDLRFIARHWKIERDQVFPNYDVYGHAGYHHNRGDFNTDACIPNGSGSRPPIVHVCCGDYPYRVWYDINNGRDMTCCEYNDDDASDSYGFTLKIGELYDSKSSQCCSNGISKLGNMCT